MHHDRTHVRVEAVGVGTVRVGVVRAVMVRAGAVRVWDVDRVRAVRVEVVRLELLFVSQRIRLQVLEVHGPPVFLEDRRCHLVKRQGMA